jgi:hypothetical protein
LEIWNALTLEIFHLHVLLLGGVDELHEGRGIPGDRMAAPKNSQQTRVDELGQYVLSMSLTNRLSQRDLLPHGMLQRSGATWPVASLRPSSQRFDHD